MMANRILSVFRSSNYHLLKLTKINNYVATLGAPQGIKQLYSKAALGIENFELQREQTQRQMGNVSEKFKEKMQEYSLGNNTKAMIFTEDLKNMIHLVKDETELDTIVRMIKLYNQQNRELRFGSFTFGPIVMRLFYCFNKPDIALECFRLPELQGFFDQVASYQILMDLLFVNKMYSEILQVSDTIKERQMEGAKYAKNVVCLTLAACYKMNSKESVEYAFRLWKELRDAGHSAVRRATTFCAALAINQGEPGIALEILTTSRNQNYTTVRNLKVVALAKAGRVEYTLPILRSILTEDIPLGEQKHTFNKEVLDTVEEAVKQLENPDLLTEFNKLKGILEKGGHIAKLSLDAQLCQEIQKIDRVDVQQRYQNTYRGRDQQRTPNKFYTYKSRPGLSELQ